MRIFVWTVLFVSIFVPSLSYADLSLTLNQEEMASAESMYQKYCSLCHGENREGYRADHAPSLRSKSMLRTAFPQLLFESIAYGRLNSAMDGYHELVGAPFRMPISLTGVTERL